MITSIAKILIRTYRALVSPFLPPSCRFYPSCSKYALDAFSTNGPVKALYLTIRRIGKCHPLNDGGYDPVPVPVRVQDRAYKRPEPGKEVF
jgi:hypothetical protein